ncbi:MAG TPA: CapA family protein [Gemmatimonadales bacterium]|nr:CapA family protein [Gemmatimonadales bacterium]
MSALPLPAALSRPDPATGFRVLPAQALGPELPDDLRAMLLYERAAVGETIRVCAVGDTGFSGQVGRTASAAGYGVLLAEVAPLFQGSQVAFANLEGTFIEHPVGDGLFTAPPAAARALRQAGVTLVHVANNHASDLGPAGLASTLSALADADLVALGAGADASASRRLVRTDRRAVRLGWLGCGRTLVAQVGQPYFWEFNEQELLAAIRVARPTVDVLIVSVHIGFMYLDYPHPDHKAMAERCAAAGADVVLMHHPHVLQGVETTSNGKILCYSLGNFLFDWKEGLITNHVMVREQNEGAAFVFDVDRAGVRRAAVVPTWTDERCAVRWARGARGAEILERLLRISRDLRGNYAPAFWRQRAERNTNHVLRMLRFYIVHGQWSSVWRMFTKVRRQHLRMLVLWVLASLRVRGRKDSHVPAG